MSRYRRTNKYLTIDGETKILEEWAELSKEWGVSRQLIQDRLARGLSDEDAVMDKPRKYAKRNELDGGRKGGAKQALNDWLKASGHWRDYNKLRSWLKSPEGGVSDKIAWRVAAFPFLGVEGAPQGLVNDSMYAEIAANWANGKYPNAPEIETYPNGLIKYGSVTSGKPAEFKEPASPEALEAVEEVKNAPKKYADEWEKMALQARDRNGTDLDAMRWAIANEPFDIKRIDIETIPSTTAVTLLKLIKSSTAVCADIVKQVWAKAVIPDRKILEYEAGRRDDGRDLMLLAESKQQIELEAAEAKGDAA